MARHLVLIIIPHTNIRKWNHLRLSKSGKYSRHDFLHFQDGYHAKKLNGRGSSGIGKPRNRRLGLAALRDLSLAIGQLTEVQLVPVPCLGEIDDEADLTAWETLAGKSSSGKLWLPRTATRHTGYSESSLAWHSRIFPTEKHFGICGAWCRSTWHTPAGSCGTWRSSFPAICNVCIISSLLAAKPLTLRCMLSYESIRHPLHIMLI